MAIWVVALLGGCGAEAMEAASRSVPFGLSAASSHDAQGPTGEQDLLLAIGELGIELDRS